MRSTWARRAATAVAIKEASRVTSKAEAKVASRMVARMVAKEDIPPRVRRMKVERVAVASPCALPLWMVNAFASISKIHLEVAKGRDAKTCTSATAYSPIQTNRVAETIQLISISPPMVTGKFRTDYHQSRS